MHIAATVVALAAALISVLVVIDVLVFLLVRGRLHPDRPAPVLRNVERAAVLLIDDVFGRPLALRRRHRSRRGLCCVGLLARGGLCSRGRARDCRTGDEAAEWEECFYRLLVQGKSVHKAFDITRQQSRASIRGVRQKDVRFGITPA